MEKSKLQFSPPILKSSYLSINDEFIKNNTPESMNNIEIPFKYQIDHSDIEDCSTFVKFTITVGEESDKYPFIAQVEMLSQFSWEKNYTDKVDNLLEVNAPALLLSYSRPIISMLTSMTPFPPYHIPFLNFTKQDDE